LGQTHKTSSSVFLSFTTLEFSTIQKSCISQFRFKKQQDGREVGMFWEVFPYSEAVYRHDLLAVWICWHEYNHQSVVESRHEPLCPGCLSSCIRHCCNRTFCHHFREEFEAENHILDLHANVRLGASWGNVVELVWTKHVHPHYAEQTTTGSSNSSDKDWFKGSILLIIATFAWASFFILQNVTMRKYKAPLSLTCLVCFIGTLQSIAVTFVMEHRPSVWSIGWDMNLLAAAYAGIVSSSIAYYVQGLVMEKRGPVFVTAFSPLMMIIVAIMGSFILAEKIYMGGVMGAILIVMGLYSVLWGKYKEHKEKELAEPVKTASRKNNDNNMMITIDGFETNDLEMQKNGTYKSSAIPTIAISAPIPTPPMIAVEAPKV
ncbi:Drug/metabolite transporter, partial [Cynara cardunculus var. scolymus]